VERFSGSVWVGIAVQCERRTPTALIPYSIKKTRGLILVMAFSSHLSDFASEPLIMTNTDLASMAGVKTVGTVLEAFIVLIVAGRAISLLNGQTSLQSFLTPGWVDFALANPELFAGILIAGTLLLGGSFVTVVKNY
jgi:hypothetical protein